MNLNKKLFNYRVVDHVEDYNFNIKLVFIRVHMKKLRIIFWYRLFRSFCFDPDESQNQV